MNLQQEIKDALWQNVKNNYESADYSGAIIDGIHYISDLIRDRAELKGDGAQLVGQAFGGKKPILKVNKLQSQSEKDAQAGVEQLLRGVYQGIRNPRSHEKHCDNKETADSVILFLNYLASIIDTSKAPFSINDYMKRVFDKGFVEDTKYAKLLVDEIPKRKRMSVFVDVFRNKETGEGKKLAFFTRELLGRFNRQEKKEAYQIVSDELKEVVRDTSIRLVIQMMPLEAWKSFDDSARMRAEGMLLKSIKEGKYDSVRKRCSEGALGTWISALGSELLMRDKFETALATKLMSGNTEEEDYVLEHFHMLYETASSPGDKVRKAILSGLKGGDVRYYKALTSCIEADLEWVQPFKEAYSQFAPPEPPAQEDVMW